MKKYLAYFFVSILILTTGVSCSKSESEEDIDNTTMGKTVEVKFYSPSVFTNNDIAPQITLRNESFQITALGRNAAGNLGPIERYYISDTSTRSEWVAIMNEVGKVEFLYEINSSTKEKLPTLYWYEDIGVGEYYLRKYNYDWTTRLGTLLYEARINGESVLVEFESESLSPNTDLSSKTSAKQNKSFKAPLVRFNELLSIKKSKFKSASVTAKAEDFLDKWKNEFFQDLQELTDKLFEAPCKVSEFQDNPDKNFVCDLADQLKDSTDEEIFNDFESINTDEINEDSFEFNGDSFEFEIDFFDNISDILGDVKEHLNDVRNDFVNGFNFSFEDFTNDFEDFYASEETNDLDDLPDSRGVLQISLNWNTSGTDIDLHVTDPNGETIFYGNPNSSSGGYLDRDDVDGFGPENIYWEDGYPDGTYTVELVYFGPSDGPFTDCDVTISDGLGFLTPYSVSLGYFDQRKVSVVSFSVENGVVFPEF